MDDSLLINLVQSAENLYDKKRSDYRDASKRENTWASIAQICGCSVAAAQSRFKSLREKFIREKNTSTGRSGSGRLQPSTWHLFSAMMWLQPHLGTRKNSASNMPLEAMNCSGSPSNEQQQNEDDSWVEYSVEVETEDNSEQILESPMSYSWPLAISSAPSSSGLSSAASSINSSAPTFRPTSAPTSRPASAPTSRPSSALSNMPHLVSKRVSQNKRKSVSPEDDMMINETLQSISNTLSTKKVDPNSAFGNMVAAELTRCMDEDAVKEAKKKIAMLLFDLP